MRVVDDPQRGTRPNDPTNATYVIQDPATSDGLYVPGHAGAYTIAITGTQGVNGTADPIEVSYTGTVEPVPAIPFGDNRIVVGTRREIICFDVDW